MTLRSRVPSFIVHLRGGTVQTGQLPSDFFFFSKGFICFRFLEAVNTLASELSMVLDSYSACHFQQLVHQLSDHSTTQDLPDPSPTLWPVTIMPVSRATCNFCLFHFAYAQIHSALLCPGLDLSSSSASQACYTTCYTKPFLYKQYTLGKITGIIWEKDYSSSEPNPPYDTLREF